MMSDDDDSDDDVDDEYDDAADSDDDFHPSISPPSPSVYLSIHLLYLQVAIGSSCYRLEGMAGSGILHP